MFTCPWVIDQVLYQSKQKNIANTEHRLNKEENLINSFRVTVQNPHCWEFVSKIYHFLQLCSNFQLAIQVQIVGE